MLYLTAFILFLLVPRLSQTYGIITGILTFFSAFQPIFSREFCSGQERISLEEPIFPLEVLGDPVNNFAVAWGLLFASRKTGSTIGFIAFILCFLNALLGVLGFAYVQFDSSIAVPGCWRGVALLIVRMIIGSCIFGPILEAWRMPQQPGISKELEQ